MNPEAKQYYSEGNSIFGLPQVYKGIELYPLKIIDLEKIDYLYDLFAYPKAAVAQQDPQIYKMSYLKFITFILQMRDDNIRDKLIEFLEFITHKKVKFFYNGEEDAMKMLIFIMIDNKKFNELDFKNMREIILEQNGLNIEYIEEYNSRLEENLIVANLGIDYNMRDQIFSFASQFGKTIEEIKNCTIYEMKNLLESMAALQEFKMQAIPLTHVGKEYEFKSYTKHLENHGRYSSILEDVQEFEKKSSYFKSNEELAS